MTEKVLFTKAQLAEALAVSERTIERWVEKGVIPYLKASGTIRFELGAVLAAIAGGRDDSER